MPWKVTRPMDERIRFVARYLDGEKMVDLCREFGISRKTGYKFLERYDKFGPSGLLDQSKRPIRLARKTADEIERLVISLRLAHPTWGSRKLREKLLQRHSGLPIPVASTIGEILSRHGLIVDRKRRPIEERLRTPTGLTDGESPNEVWCCDFKGQFRLSNGQYCYPLTVTDHASRYIIGCESLASTKVEPARAIFEELFDLYGLPSIIRSDNGVPFSARGFGGLSRLVGQSLPVKLKTSQLIVAQESPMSIEFRYDEKRFDVRGAYNIRYELIKKRIDKATISGSGERLTEPGTVSVVFSQESERREYEVYFHYLTASGVLESKAEVLDLEELQDVTGLRALRGQFSRAFLESALSWSPKRAA